MGITTKVGVWFSSFVHYWDWVISPSIFPMHDRKSTRIVMFDSLSPSSLLLWVPSDWSSSEQLFLAGSVVPSILAEEGECYLLIIPKQICLGSFITPMLDRSGWKKKRMRRGICLHLIRGECSHFRFFLCLKGNCEQKCNVFQTHVCEVAHSHWLIDGECNNEWGHDIW